MRTRLGMLTVAVLALAGAACSDDGDGGDDTGAEEQAYVDAMVAAVDADNDGPFSIGASPACLSSRWVELIGVERLERAGIEPEDFASENGPDMVVLGLDDAEADQLYEAYGRCDVDLRQLVIDEVVADAADKETLRACVESALTEDGVRALMTDLFRVGADGMDEATERGTLDPAVERAIDGMGQCAMADAFGRVDPDGDGDG